MSIVCSNCFCVNRSQDLLRKNNTTVGLLESQGTGFNGKGVDTAFGSNQCVDQVRSLFLTVSIVLDSALSVNREY